MRHVERHVARHVARHVSEYDARSHIMSYDMSHAKFHINSHSMSRAKSHGIAHDICAHVRIIRRGIASLFQNNVSFFSLESIEKFSFLKSRKFFLEQTVAVITGVAHLLMFSEMMHGTFL